MSALYYITMGIHKKAIDFCSRLRNGTLHPYHGAWHFILPVYLIGSFAEVPDADLLGKEIKVKGTQAVIAECISDITWTEFENACDKSETGEMSSGKWRGFLHPAATRLPPKTSLFQSPGLCQNQHAWFSPRQLRWNMTTKEGNRGTNRGTQHLFF